MAVTFGLRLVRLGGWFWTFVVRLAVVAAILALWIADGVMNRGWNREMQGYAMFIAVVICICVTAGSFVLDRLRRAS